MVEKVMLTRQQAADWLAVNPKTIDRMILAKQLKVIKLSRKCVRIPVENLQKLIKDKTQ
jgi:excisionase family DNA binding protein